MKIIIKRKINKRFFYGSDEEYIEVQAVHDAESAIYRKNPQFIIGKILVAVPLLYIALAKEWWLALPVIIGVTWVQDSLSAHYCTQLNRERKKKSNHH